MEHNYDNLHLEGTLDEKRRMVHNQIPIRHGWPGVIGNLMGAFMAVAIGTVVLSEFMQTLKKEGLK